MKTLMLSSKGKLYTAFEKVIFEKVIIVTRRTQMEELIARFNTKAQAKFYLEHAGEDFEAIEAAHVRYHTALDVVRGLIPRGTKSQLIERAHLPQFTFSEEELVVTVGPDGLVVNTAKYLHNQPLLAINPDPEQIDGILLLYTVERARRGLPAILRGEGRMRAVSMAQARLRDGQTLLAVNDLFIGASSHISARYRIAISGKTEEHSSSGIIISTGAGSTGWLRSIYSGAAGVAQGWGFPFEVEEKEGRIPWEADYLIFAVREPFPSKATQTSLVFGRITRESPLMITSRMAQNGVIFSDGIESDYLSFNAGAVASIGVADRKLNLLVD
jgi:NAD kinase